MRQRTIILLAGTLVLAFSGMAAYTQVPSRDPASDSFSIPQEHAKHLAPIKAAILPVANIPVTPDEEVTLVGHITINNTIDSDLSYEWIVPNDVTVIEGELSDDLANVQVGQTVELKLVVAGFDKEREKQIVLQASAMKGHLELGSSALITSRPEDNLESVAPQMQRAAEETLGMEKFRKRR